jgi:hypothetical protein
MRRRRSVPLLRIRSHQWTALKSWSVRLAKCSSLKKAKIAVARKLAVVMHRMWREGALPMDGWQRYAEDGIGSGREGEFAGSPSEAVLGPLLVLAAAPAEFATATGAFVADFLLLWPVRFVVVARLTGVGVGAPRHAAPTTGIRGARHGAAISH